MELVRAKIFTDGYNAGTSHEAEVSYSKLIGFSNKDATYLDELRYYRNGTKYYGTILTIEYAHQVLEFLNRIYPNLIKILEK